MNFILIPKTVRSIERTGFVMLKRFQQQDMPRDPNQSRRNQQVDPKSFAFNFAGVKKHYELIPVIGCCAIGLSFAGYTIYRALLKNDVMIDRTKELPPWERVDLEKKEINKIFVAQQKFRGLPELKKLKKEINEGPGNGGNGQVAKAQNNGKK